jgi:hypothetical protein
LPCPLLSETYFIYYVIERCLLEQNIKLKGIGISLLLLVLISQSSDTQQQMLNMIYFRGKESLVSPKCFCIDSWAANLYTSNLKFTVHCLTFLNSLCTGQNHNPCIAGLPSIALLCHPLGQLLQLHSVRTGKHLHPHSKFID